MPASGPHAPWRLWILVLFFVLQMLFLLLSIVLYALVVVTYNSLRNNPEYSLGANLNVSSLSVAGVSLNFALFGLMMLLTIIEIVKCGLKRLSPMNYLTANLTKSVILCISFALSIANGSRTALSIGVSVAMLLLFVIPVIYASITLHKVRKQRRPQIPEGTYLTNQIAYQGSNDGLTKPVPDSYAPSEGLSRPAGSDPRFETSRLTV